MMGVQPILNVVFVGVQGCFRQNITVVTMYASLGVDALIHSLNEVWDSLLFVHLIYLIRLSIM